MGRVVRLMEETAYRQFAELEENHFWFIGRRRIFMHLLARELGNSGDAEILDVGCGVGGMLGPLSRFGRVRGIDTSSEAIRFCRKRGFDACVGSAYELPVATEALDLITLFDTIEHVPDDLRALRECRRALQPDGLLFVSVPAYQLLYANNDRVAHHERRYTARALRKRLIAADLDPIQVTYFNTLLFPVILPAVMAKKLYERFSSPDETTNLSHTIPGPVNRALAAVMGSERRLLFRVSMPFGHSIIALARRSAEGETSRHGPTLESPRASSQTE